MGDRRGQFTHGGDPRHMRELFALLPKLQFRPAPSHSLQQQACDHCCLQGENKQRAENGPSILLPQRGRSKSNDTVSWQFAWMPALLPFFPTAESIFDIAGASELSSLTHHSPPGYFTFGGGISNAI